MNFAKISSKIVLCLLTILFWGAAFGLGYVGVNMMMTGEKYGDMLTYLYSMLPALVAIFSAALIFLIGIIGVCGLFSENRCLLGTYFTLLVLLLGAQVAGISLLFVYRQHVAIYVKERFDDSLKTYGFANNTKASHQFDFLQNIMKCCGELNYTDWQHTWWYDNTKDRYGNVPQSCCVNYVINPDSTQSSLTAGLNNRKLKQAITQAVTNGHKYCTATSSKPTPQDNFYIEGCYSKISTIIQSRFAYIAGMILALVIIQFIGLISTCVLMFCRNKNAQQPPYINIATHEDAHYNL